MKNCQRIGVCLFPLFVLLTMSECDTPSKAGNPNENDFKVVGYAFFPGGKGDVNRIPYEYLTDINFAFARPAADSSGNLEPLRYPDLLRDLVAQAHANGVRVFISVGGFNIGDGPGIDDRFEILANSERSRTTFAHSVMQMIRDFDLDGADVDWEFPEPFEPSFSDFVSLMRELSDSLRPAGKKLTAAVESHHEHYTYGVSDEIFPIVDWLNIMTYDNEYIGSHRPHPLTPHSPYWLQLVAYDQWVTQRGLPSDKAVMGVPFYGKARNKRGLPYHRLLAMGADPYSDVYADPSSDTPDSVYYNGIRTIKKRTQHAMANAAGIMIWHIMEDTTGQYSLLKAIHEARKN